MIAVTFTSHPPCAAPQTDKTALSLPVSAALYAHDTSSSFVISLPSHTSSLTASRLSFICKYLCGGRSGIRGKKRKKCFPQWENKHSLTILQVSLCYLIGHGLQTDWGLLSPIKGWGLTGRVNTQWWLIGKGNQVDSAEMDPCGGKNRGGGVGQNKLHHKCIFSRRACGETMPRVLFHSSFLNLVGSITLITGLLWINQD